MSFAELNKYGTLEPEFSVTGYSHWDASADEVPPCDIKIGDITIPRAWPIGAGAYGMVYRGEALTTTGYSVPVVVKMTKTASSTPSRAFQTEILSHWGLSSSPTCSPAVACMLGAFRTTLGVPENVKHGLYHYCIVLERMSGDLYELARLGRYNAEAPTGSLICLGLRMALHMIYDVLWMYLRGYHHNDVKPENFLFDWSGGQYRMKVSDLGLACLRDDVAGDPRAVAARKAARAASLSAIYDDRTAIDLGEIAARSEPILNCRPAGTRLFMSPLMLEKYDSGALDTTTYEHAYNDFYGAAVSARVLFAVMRLLGSLDETKLITDEANMRILRGSRVSLAEPFASFYADTPVEAAIESLGFLMVPAPPEATEPRVHRASMADHVIALLSEGITYLERSGTPAPQDLAGENRRRRRHKETPLPSPPPLRSETEMDV